MCSWEEKETKPECAIRYSRIYANTSSANLKKLKRRIVADLNTQLEV